MKNIKLVLLLIVLVTDSLQAQTPVNYQRIVPTGQFRNPVFWSPFNSASQPPIIGPGGANDRVIFDLGQSFQNLYTITEVQGINEQLFVRNDAVRLQISDYELTGQIWVGDTPGDIGILVLEGEPESTLTALTMQMGGAGSVGSVIVDSPGLTLDIANIESMSGDFLVFNGNVDTESIGIYQNAVIRILDDSTVDTREFFICGDNCFLNIQNGGSLFSEYFEYFGDGPNTGVNVEGENSSLICTESLNAFSNGDGHFDVLDGGLVLCRLIEIDRKTSSWVARVNGDGSSLSAIEELIVGCSGDAGLVVADQGFVFGSEVIVANGPSTVADVTVTGINSTLCCNDLTIGDQGVAFLDVFNGGRVESETASIGEFIGPRATSPLPETTPVGRTQRI